MKTLKVLSLIFIALLLANCSTTQEVAKEGTDQAAKGEEVYVFDTVQNDTLNTPQTEVVTQEPVVIQKKEEASVTQNVSMYIVQIGAFSTEARAVKFINDNKAKTDFEMTSHFSEDKNLYVVQLAPFRSREEAEKVRNTLWQTKEFKDAFIVPQK